MVTWLSTNAIPHKSAPYSWRLSGDETVLDDNTGSFDATSDGYKIIAMLGWVHVGDEEKN